MVGVPGRSKGCATCRKRKKGCDLQRPACGQCVKAGLDCGGYDRQRIFINHSAAPSATALLTTREPVLPPCSSVQSSFQIVLPDALTRSAYEVKSLGLFWDAYLPSGQTFTSTQAQFTTGSWLRFIDSLYHREDTLKHALLALSLGTVGQQQGDSWMTQQGLASHGRALREMAMAVDSPERARQDEMLAAARLLGLFQILFGANDQDKFAQARSWSSHVNGELSLSQARGPQAYMVGNAHQLFSDGRLNNIISAIRCRKKTLWSDPEWKTIPWLVVPKTPKDALLDIMADVPTIMEKLDSAEACSDSYAKSNLAKTVVQACWNLDMQLTEWVLNMNFIMHLDIDKISRVDEIGDFAMSHLTYLYWVTCILIYTTLQSANRACAEPQLLPARIDQRIFARKIAQSASYFFSPEAGIFGAHAASFPIGIALSVLTNPDNQVEEDHKLLTNLFQHGRLEVTIGKFLNSMRAGYQVSLCKLRGPNS